MTSPSPQTPPTTPPSDTLNQYGFGPVKIPARSHRNAILILVGAAIAAVIVIVAVLLGNADKGGSGGAVTACENTVRGNLRAPTTAQFSAEQVTSYNEGTWFDINGSVDSQNGFGAMLRSPFNCTVTVGDGGTYTVTGNIGN